MSSPDPPRGQGAHEGAQLRQVVSAFLAGVSSLTVTTPDPMITDLAALAEFTARARSPIFFDFHRGEIDYIPPPEGPGRFAKQLHLLTQALAIIRGHDEVAAGDYLTAFKVAQDSLPPQRRIMLEVLLDGPAAILLRGSAGAKGSRAPT